MAEKKYLCIDLKSFFASVECVERGLNPLTTNLVVADRERTEKTICLAVTPSLKAFGISGRSRLFEVVQKVREVNNQRKLKAPQRTFVGKSFDAKELSGNSSLELDYIVAPPRMAYYMEYSTRIYNVYLKYISPEDIHVYSIDEVFIDITHYLATYKLSAHDFARKLIQDVLNTTGITATAGIGTNMYLAKIAMDIEAKHIPADKDGVRIAELDEASYREKMWSHKPITDFWRVGKGYANKLERYGMRTMGDVARCSLYDEDLLYRIFGINAELLIDHAWGWEPCTIKEIKAYKPSTNSLSSGQVLKTPYYFDKAKLVTREMAEALALDLVEKKIVTNQVVLTIGYDIENLTDDNIQYKGDIITDFYGRKVPKQAHGTANIERYTASSKLIVDATMELFDRIVDKSLLVRRITIAVCKLQREKDVRDNQVEQLDLFTDYEKKNAQEESLAKEKRMQEAVLSIKKKYGKNAILKGMNLEEGATAKERNSQIGGHKA
ncbi:MAG: DNA methylase [Clostridia bacterium]|nr:DNA methylase [Clostridia bacterium]